MIVKLNQYNIFKIRYQNYSIKTFKNHKPYQVSLTPQTKRGVVKKNNEQKEFFKFLPKDAKKKKGAQWIKNGQRYCPQQ